MDFFHREIQGSDQSADVCRRERLAIHEDHTRVRAPLFRPPHHRIRENTLAADRGKRRAEEGIETLGDFLILVHGGGNGFLRQGPLIAQIH